MKVGIGSLLRSITRRLPVPWRTGLRWRRRPVSAQGSAAPSRYDERVRQEVARFSGGEVINDLPPIFSYWSNTYLRPRLEHFGFSYPEDFFARAIERQARKLARPVSIASVGAGSGDAEVAVAKLLRERGVSGFHIDCLDITPAMLARGRALAEREGTREHLGFVHVDFNLWEPAAGSYDVVMANQSLHHVTNLEGLFDAIHRAIGEEGVFVTSDMIGRNGHMRWPEALVIVQEFWRELPEEYRYNRQLRRQEEVFDNWDCSMHGFEGIRAQDILPLLVERFGFDFFFGFGNLVDPFIDRGFGPNFDPGKDWDRTFIDRVHARDEAEILAGRIKPTHLLATMRRARATRPVVWQHLTPEFCMRQVS